MVAGERLAPSLSVRRLTSGVGRSYLVRSQSPGSLKDYVNLSYDSGAAIAREIGVHEEALSG